MSAGTTRSTIRSRSIRQQTAKSVSKAELEQARRSMSLNELKAKPINQLVKVAESMGLESLARSRKQDIIFSILKHYAQQRRDRSTARA